jgi:uncharacterized protein (UPF0335 family)
MDQIARERIDSLAERVATLEKAIKKLGVTEEDVIAAILGMTKKEKSLGNVLLGLTKTEKDERSSSGS